MDRSSRGGRACSAAPSALSAVSAGERGGEVGGGAGKETRTYLLAIRPISAPLVGASCSLTATWCCELDHGGRPAEFSEISQALPREMWGNETTLKTTHT